MIVLFWSINTGPPADSRHQFPPYALCQLLIRTTSSLCLMLAIQLLMFQLLLVMALALCPDFIPNIIPTSPSLWEVAHLSFLPPTFIMPSILLALARLILLLMWPKSFPMLP